jgi:hypothetical protein
MQTLAPPVRGSVRFPRLFARAERVLAYRNGSWLALGATILAMCAAAPAVAQSDPPPARRDKYSGAPLPPTKQHQVPSPITDRFAVRASYFDSRLNTSLRVDSTTTGTPGTLVSAEKDLGLPAHVNQGRVELYIRMLERHRLRVDYYESDRSGSQALTKPINFANETFLPGDVAVTSFDFRMFGLTYTYSLVHMERFELGAGVGIYFLEGDARGKVPARQLSQEVSGVAPFPTLALDGTWRISTRFSFVARGQYFSDSVSNASGTLGDYHADFQYRWRPNFAVGLGYTQLRSALRILSGSFPGYVSLDAHGPEFFFRVSY